MLPSLGQAPYAGSMPLRHAFSTAAITAVLLTAGGLAAGTPVIAAPSTPITIAVEAPLTGAQANNGMDMYRGVKLAVDQVNAKGGVLGRPVQLIKADDQANPALAQSVAQSVQAAGAVAVIGPYDSSVGLVNLPTYVQNRIVPVQLTSTDQTTGLGVTVQPKNSQISPVEIAYMQDGYGYTGCPTVVMLVDPSDYTVGMADRVDQGMMCGDGAPKARITVTPGQPNYTAQVSAALALSPDILYVSTYYPEGAAIAKAILAAKTKAHCFMGLANVDPAFVTEAGLPAARNCTFSGVPAAAQLPSAANYVAAYKKAFGKQPGVWGTFTYDSTMMLFAAMTKAGSTDYAPVLKNLKATKGYAGQTGTINMNAKNGNRVKPPVFILEVDKKGVFVVKPGAA